tara:strand:- start:294 stop:1256 length:963 start_codon:yes stop_codon:yes gene_type:complete
MNKKNIAVLGLGYWGTIVVKTLVSLKKFDKIYIYDVDFEKVNILIEKFKNKVRFIEINQLIKNKAIKYVYLATPPKNNFKLLRKFINAKKNILIEKPGLIKLDQYSKIEKDIKKNKVKLTFGYIYIYNNYIRLIKKIISSKKLGKIKYINFQRQNFGPIRNKVSSVYDLATHDLSILNFLFNKKMYLKKKIGHDILNKKNDDIAYMNLTVGNVKVDINVSWLNPEKIRKIIIIGSKKMLLFDEMNIFAPIKIYNNYVNFPKIDKFSKYFFNQSKYIYKGSSISIRLKSKKPLDEEIKEFIKNKKSITNLKFSKKIIKTLC